MKWLLRFQLTIKHGHHGAWEDLPNYTTHLVWVVGEIWNSNISWEITKFLTTRLFCLGVIVLTLLIIVVVVVLPFLSFWNPIILESFWFPIILESFEILILSNSNHFDIILFSWSRISILWVLFIKSCV